MTCLRCGGHFGKPRHTAQSECNCPPVTRKITVSFDYGESKKDLIEKAANSAAKILLSAFVACGLSDRIRATYDDEDGNRYLISFEKIETV